MFDSNNNRNYKRNNSYQGQNNKYPVRYDGYQDEQNDENEDGTAFFGENNYSDDYFEDKYDNVGIGYNQDNYKNDMNYNDFEQDDILFEQNTTSNLFEQNNDMFEQNDNSMFGQDDDMFEQNDNSMFKQDNDMFGQNDNSMFKQDNDMFGQNDNTGIAVFGQDDDMFGQNDDTSMFDQDDDYSFSQDSYYNSDNTDNNYEYQLSVIGEDSQQEKFVNPFEDKAFGMDIGQVDPMGLDDENMYQDEYNNTFDNGYQGSDNFNDEYDMDSARFYNPFSNKADDYSRDDFSNDDFDNYQPNENSYDTDYEVTVVKPKEGNVFFNYAMTLMLIICVGFICGRIVNSMFYGFWNRYISNNSSIILEVAKMIGLVFLAWLCSKVHVALHTLGHFIGGRISSYELVSIRLFGYVFVKSGDTMTRKRGDLYSTMGECVMMPPEGDGVNYPFLLYKLGGIVMNLISSLLVLLLYMEVGFLRRYPFNMVAVIFALVGIVTILYNGIPLIINGQPNDGYIVAQMLTSSGARRAVHAKLLVSGFLARGGRYTDVPEEQLILDGRGDYSSNIAIQVKMLQYKRYMEDMDFVSAANCLNSVDSYYRKLPKINQYDVTCEKLFLELIGENSPEKVKQFMDAGVKKYLEDTQKSMSTSRLMFAYQACFKNNMKAAAKYYKLLKKNSNSEPLQGEVDFEIMLAEYINERFCENAFQ